MYLTLTSYTECNMNIEKFNLSKEHTIYRTKYSAEYTKEDFIKRIAQNKSVITKKVDKKVEDRVLIECNEFSSVNNYVIEVLESIEGKKIDKVAKLGWVYTQKEDFTMIMHKHDYLYYTTEKTNLETKWTCVFYIQIPKNLKEGEGDIIFMTEDKKLHTFTPKENDILIFSGKLYHMVTPIPSAEVDRVVYASNFNFDL